MTEWICFLPLSLWLAHLLGQAMIWAWARVHTADPSALQRDWLSLLSATLLPLALIIALFIVFDPVAHPTSDAWDLAPQAALPLWAAVQSRRRSARESVPLVAASCMPALLVGSMTEGWILTPLGLVMTAVSLACVRLGAGREEPVPDPHIVDDSERGTTTYSVLTRSPVVSAIVLFSSIALIFPAITLAIFPQLRRGQVVSIRIAGEDVEVRVGQHTRRVAMSGGSVRVTMDAFGSEGIELRGRDGTEQLLLGGVPARHVAKLADRLRAATEAPPNVAHEPPESLRRLQSRSVEHEV